MTDFSFFEHVNTLEEEENKEKIYVTREHNFEIEAEDIMESLFDLYNNNFSYKIKENFESDSEKQIKNIKNEDSEDIIESLFHSHDSNFSYKNKEDFKIVSENQRRQIKVNKNEYIKELSEIIKSEEFEAGYYSKAEEYFKSLQKISKDTANIIINSIFANALMDKDLHTINGILNIISQASYDEVFPIGQTIAIAATRINNKEVIGNAIMAFEYWRNPKCIKYLEAIEFSTPWIDKYKRKVVERLKLRVIDESFS